MVRGFQHTLIYCCIAVISFVFTACNKNDDDGVEFWTTTFVPTDKLEVPTLKTGNRYVQHDVTISGQTIMNYCLEYDATKGHSRWVAFRFDDKTRGKDASRRTDAWADDPKLPTNEQIGTGYFGSPYNRGHLCASYDRVYNSEANAQTFYMSNMSPMEGNFNAYYWVAFEQWVQARGRKPVLADTLYVCKGGYIDDESDIRESLWRSNGMKVVVPKHYFIAVLSCKNNHYNSIGFWVEHDSHGYTNYMSDSEANTVVANHAVSINELESKTGIDFFPRLPDDQEEIIESYKNINAW